MKYLIAFRSLCFRIRVRPVSDVPDRIDLVFSFNLVLMPLFMPSRWCLTTLHHPPALKHLLLHSKISRRVQAKHRIEPCTTMQPCPDEHVFSLMQHWECEFRFHYSIFHTDISLDECPRPILIEDLCP